MHRAALWVFLVFAVFTASLLGSINVFVGCCKYVFLILDSAGFPSPHILSTEQEEEAHGCRSELRLFMLLTVQFHR